MFSSPLHRSKGFTLRRACRQSTPSLALADRSQTSDSITFNVRTILSARNGVLDLGTWLLAHGMRGGAFGSRELEDILESDVSEFKCDPSFDDEPVFLSRGSRSSLTTRPLDADKATRAFRDLLRATGASTGQSEYASDGAVYLTC